MNNTDPIKIVEAKTSAQKKQFIHFPYRLYKGEKNWVPPLLITQKKLFTEKNIFWKKNPHCFFLALKNEKCVGRIAAFINRQHNNWFKVNDGFFGFLEAEDDQNIFDKLLVAAENFLKQFSCTQIIGPMNPDIHNELGVLADGFDSPPYFMLTHNHRYYDAQIKARGYSKLKDFYSYLLPISGYVPTPKMERVSAILQKRHNITIRNPEIKNFKQELAVLYEIYNDAFTDHWGFSPIHKDEFMELAKDLMSIVDTRIILIAEIRNEAVAFLLCLPNLNELLAKMRSGKLLPFNFIKILTRKKKIKSARVITVAVKKAYQHLGIGSLLYPEIMKRGIQCNYTTSELSWVAEDNHVMNQITAGLCADPYKTYRLYVKQL